MVSSTSTAQRESPPEAPRSDGRAAAPEVTALQPNLSRLASDLQRLAEIGAEANTGVTRPPFTPEERKAHQLMGRWMEAAGLQVRVDPFGNTIGVRKGRQADLPAIGLGSHLDSVYHGGRFDGTVGSVSALEVVRMLNEAEIVTDRPLWVVCFAAEEGARFGEACLGSKAISGILEPRDLERLRDASGVTLSEAMRQVGIDPASLAGARWQRGQLAAFLELHIEQARVLELEQKKIGLVDAVAGNTRVRLEFHGRADHSGGTPMHYRRDALVAAAEVVVAAEAIANEPRRRATVATVGRLDVYPNSITTVPGHVVVYLDVRDVDSDRQRATAQDILAIAQQVAARRGVELVYEVLSDTSPAVMPVWLRELTTDVARRLGLPHRAISSGAGHDSAILSRVIPAALIFVPSHDGASHCPEEWTSVDDIAEGVRVLAHSVLSVDRMEAGQR
ncbi:MAG: Zn-dependent hydrolase [Chloroflexi bacterium]|nr:Zn-dependent hydrolase [Chloroflexota bacterium]